MIEFANRAGTGQTVFGIISFKLRALDEPVVCDIRRIRGAAGTAPFRAASHYSLIFRVF
jgi:hypothetical protein